MLLNYFIEDMDRAFISVVSCRVCEDRRADNRRGTMSTMYIPGKLVHMYINVMHVNTGRIYLMIPLNVMIMIHLKVLEY